MTRDQITAKVATQLGDNNVFYEADDLNDSIQDGYAEVAGITGCIFKATTVNIEANLSYYDFGALISDYLAVTAMFNPQTKRWMTPVSVRQLEDIREDWELATGNSFLFWPVNFRFVAIYPRLTVSSGQLYVYYRAQADVLTGSSTPQIPEEHQAVLESYVTGDLLEQAEEFTKAQIEFDNYEKSILALRYAVRKFRLPDYQPRLA